MIASQIEELARFSDAPPVTRIVFTEPDLKARAWLKGLCGGLQVREDAVGNLFARWTGTEPELPAVGTGSHIDAIPSSGKYDGTVGVLGGLNAIRLLQAEDFRPRRSIELLLFTSEEPTRFGIGCLGSRILSGQLGPEADGLIDRDGKNLAEVRKEAGFTGPLEPLPPNHYIAFIELHIEQGPILEREGIGLGIVTHIAAPASLRIQITGEGGHAGTVLMPERRDAFTAGAQLTLAIESAALATGWRDTVATTGVCRVFPGAVNSIPSRVELEVDIRDIDLERRNSVLRAVSGAAGRIAQARNVNVQIETVNADPPATCDPGVVDALVQAADGGKYRKMVSRAYHDSLFMSRLCPVAMLFIPCRHGVSHRPDEFASEADMDNGTRVLARALEKLAI